MRFDRPWNGGYDAPPRLPLKLGGIPLLVSATEVRNTNTGEITTWVKGAEPGGTEMKVYVRSKVGESKRINPVLNQDSLTQFINDAPARYKTVESIGTQTINGRPCHGFKINGPITVVFNDRDGHTTDRQSVDGTWQTEWMDDDTGIVVKAKVGEDGSTSELTEFSSQAPDPSVFQPPAGYVEKDRFTR